MKNIYAILLSGSLLILVGCSPITKATKAVWGASTETAKVIWGSSTRALEKAKVDAISKTYRCSMDDCYDAVLNLARKKESVLEKKNITEKAGDESEITPVKETARTGYFDLFIDNRKKGHIVVMGIQGNVNTTEAGIFFSQPTLSTVKLEVTSLSSSAKRKVADKVFYELDKRFSEQE